MGVSTLQMNLLAEVKSAIDEQIDDSLSALGKSSEPLIVDARLGWHFIPDSFKVHVVVAPSVASERLLRGRYSSVEQYRSADDARQAADARANSEQRRFLSKYGVNIFLLRNYDLVIDSSDGAPEQIARCIIDSLETTPGPRTVPEVWISPRRVIPAGDAVREIAEHGPLDLAIDDVNDVPALPAVVGYARPFFFLLQNHKSLSRQIDEGQLLAPAVLRAENDDLLVGGLSATQYFRAETRPSWIYDWEDAHDFRFGDYPEEIETSATP
jgi:cytidylate kinase